VRIPKILILKGLIYEWRAGSAQNLELQGFTRKIFWNNELSCGLRATKLIGHGELVGPVTSKRSFSTALHEKNLNPCDEQPFLKISERACSLHAPGLSRYHGREGPAIENREAWEQPLSEWCGQKTEVGQPPY
jgi:hypothetical protein